jgi:hypothetical protein
MEGGKTMKISLNQQIDAMRREIRDLESERPRYERQRGYNFREFNYHLDCLRCALNTLVWVQRHESALRALPEGKS